MGAIPEDIPDFSPSVIQGISGAEQGRQVLRAIRCLSKNQARAILIDAVEEIPRVDIAVAMDCREMTVRKHAARARDTEGVQLEVGRSRLPPLSERIGPKSKNATDSTDSTDSISLADDTFELERLAPSHD